MSSNANAFLHNQTYVLAGLVEPLQASCCFCKKRISSNRDNVWHEHIFGQVTVIFIVLLFVGLI